MKKELQERFNELYKGKRLLAIQLDGFSHNVYYDSGSKDSEVIQEVYSAYSDYPDCTTRAKELLSEFSHYAYQNNAKEIIYTLPQDR